MPVTTLHSTALTTIYVKIDTFGRDITGRLFSTEGEKHFRGLTNMLFAMEEIYDSLKMPQASCTSRSFLQQRNEQANNLPREYPPMKYEMPTAPQNEQATFIIRVKYRQNATWQGEITWVGEEKTKYFRSDLEMLKLMDEALDKTFPEADDVKWEKESGPEKKSEPTG